MGCSYAFINNSNFSKNQAFLGGSIAIKAKPNVFSDIRIQNSKFSSNKAIRKASLSGKGGAIYVSGVQSFNLSYNTFEENKAEAEGGGFYFEGISYRSNLTSLGNVFRDNSALENSVSSLGGGSIGWRHTIV